MAKETLTVASIRLHAARIKQIPVYSERSKARTNILRQIQDNRLALVADKVWQQFLDFGSTLGYDDSQEFGLVEVNN